jgi:hypothetical protein
MVAFAGALIRLNEDWPVHVKYAPTDWPYTHSHGVAHADRRGAVIWIPRSFDPGAPIFDVWAFLVYEVAHELQHCYQFERDFGPGVSQREPQDVVADAIYIEEVTAITEVMNAATPDVPEAENEAANRIAFAQLRSDGDDDAAERDREDEEEAIRVGTARLFHWHDEPLSARDSIRFKHLQPPAWWS